MPFTIDDISLANTLVVRDTEEQVAVVADERLVVVSDSTIGPPGKDALKASALLGDGVALSFVFVHNLNTDKVMVQVHTTATGEILTDCRRFIVDSLRVRVDFLTPPDVGEVTVIVLG